MVSRKLGRISGRGVGVADERPDARPSGAHGLAPQALADDARALLEDEVHLLLRGLGLKGNGAGSVRRARHSRALPWKQVEHPAVLCEPDEPHARTGSVVWKYKVGAVGGHHDRLRGRVRHGTHGVGEDAAGVHHLLGAQAERLARLAVAHEGARDARPVRSWITSFVEEALDLGVVDAPGAGIHGREHDVETHARIVLLPVEDDEPPHKLLPRVVLLPQPRHLEER
mmetsp:Transcript_24700/g.76924  ORF Transcript_24700/g.76924 Transcript_24700/m.76924 type:complete len:227 (-) Transcript_24700:791-1471(-)